MTVQALSRRPPIDPTPFWLYLGLLIVCLLSALGWHP